MISFYVFVLVCIIIVLYNYFLVLYIFIYLLMMNFDIVTLFVDSPLLQRQHDVLQSSQTPSDSLGQECCLLVSISSMSRCFHLKG